MKASMVVVCHHSSEVLAECVASFRRAGEEASVATEVVAVEQSEDEGEEGAVASLGVDRMVVRSNAGYAAGLNSGMKETSGEVVLLANPDIRFAGGSLGPLLENLGDGYDVVGPQFVWDAAGEILFPPAEDPAPSEELRRILRSRWQWRWQSDLAASLEGLWSVWSAGGPVAVPNLRGPLLVMTRESAGAFGPLDEDYFLYYEETEWLWRARRAGARFALVANSRVTHHWGHSTARCTDRDQVEARSRERFFARNYSAAWRWVLRRVAGTGSGAGVNGEDIPSFDHLPETTADLWLFSTFRHLDPAVGCVARSRPPEALSEITATGRWYALAANRVENGWNPVGSWAWGRE